MNQTDMADLNIAFTMLVDKLLQYADDNSKFNQTVGNLPAILENFRNRLEAIEYDLDFGNGPTSPRTFWDRCENTRQAVDAVNERLGANFESIGDRMQRLEDKFDHLSAGTEEFITQVVERVIDERLDAYLHSSTVFENPVENIIRHSDNAMSYSDTKELIEELLGYYDPTDAHHFDREVERVVGDVLDEKLEEALESLDMKIVVNS